MSQEPKTQDETSRTAHVRRVVAIVARRRGRAVRGRRPSGGAALEASASPANTGQATGDVPTRRSAGSGARLRRVPASDAQLGGSRRDRPARPAAATGYREPSGPPIFRLQVDALPSLHFQATEFTVPAGIIQINYVDCGGTHTLIFDDPRFAGFELEVPDGQRTGKVRLTPGDYLIYCTEPGHRAAGMQATIHVVP
jgi:hypothetical protein